MWYHTQVDTTSGRLAQLVEHLLDVQEVTGSSPVPSTIQFVPEPDFYKKGSGIFILCSNLQEEEILHDTKT